MNRKIDIIPAETMNALSVGPARNVREIENVIERSVIRSKSPILNVPLSELGATAEGADGESTPNSR